MGIAMPPFPRLQRGKLISDGLVLSLPFYEGKGPKVHDVSGFENHGTLTSMDPPTDWVASNAGWALDFDGSNDFIEIIDRPSLEPTKFSISMWLLTSGQSGQEHIMRKENGTDARSYGLILNSDGILRLEPSSVATASALTTGVWLHIGASLDAAAGKIYVGVGQTQFATGAGAAITYGGATADLHIGKYGDSFPEQFHGRLRDIRMYNRVLSAHEFSLIRAGHG